MPTASRASEWSLLPASFQTAWPALQEEFPGAAVKFNGGRVQLIYGRALGGGETPLLSASHFLSEYGGDLFGLTGDDLVLERAVEPGPDDGPARVHYRQFHGGVPVHGAGLRFTISTDRGHLISLLSSSLHPTPGPYLQPARQSAEDAERIVRAIYGSEDIEISAPSRVIMPAGSAPEYAWQVDAVPVGRDRDAERFFISALDGRTMKRRRLVHDFADFTAEVKGDNSDADARPIDCNGVSNLIALQWVEVRVFETGVCDPCYDVTDETDVMGQATFMGVPATFNVTASLENDWFRLIDSFAECPPPENPNCCSDPTSPCNIRALTGDQNETMYHFLEGEDEGEGQQERTIQMVETWRWLNTARKWVADLDPGFPLGAQVRVLCNIQNSICLPNYRFTDKTLLLNNRDAPARPCDGGGGSCTCGCIGEGEERVTAYVNDQHYNSISVHEYGHHLHRTANSTVNHGTWNETIADAFSAFVIGDSLIGPDICECADDFADRTRDIDTDMTWPSMSPVPRENGRVMASGYWDMRVDLLDDDLAGKYLLHGIENATGAGIDPTIALLAVTADDDSGINGEGDDDLTNGSPNYETINAAFRKHDLATKNVAYVDIDWSGSAPGDVADDEDLKVTVTVDPGSLTLDPPVKLRWRKNSGISGPGAWSLPVDMEYRMLQDDYQVSISSSNYAVGDVIDFYVRAKVEETDKLFTCFPTQAQFDWTASPPAEERDFFSVLVTNSPKATALSDDLFGNPGWMVDPNEWEFGAPTLAELSEQPGNDYPFDVDLGPGPAPQPSCYFTSDTESVDGEWNLTTEEFDLSEEGIDYAVVSYALWFYARKATVGQDKFQVLITDTFGELLPIQTIDVEGGGGNDEKLVRWIRQRIKVTPGEGIGQVDFGTGMKLTFRANEVSAVVEAVVDEVRVWGVFDQ